MKRLYFLVFTLLVFSVLLNGCSLMKQRGDTSKPGEEIVMQENRSSSYVLSIDPADGSRNQPCRDLYVKIKFSSLVSLRSINANPSLPANICVMNSDNSLYCAIYDCAISKQQPGISFQVPELKANSRYTILIRNLQSTDGNELPEYTSSFTTE